MNIPTGIFYSTSGKKQIKISERDGEYSVFCSQRGYDGTFAFPQLLECKRGLTPRSAANFLKKAKAYYGFTGGLVNKGMATPKN